MNTSAHSASPEKKNLNYFGTLILIGAIAMALGYCLYSVCHNQKSIISDQAAKIFDDNHTSVNPEMIIAHGNGNYTLILELSTGYAAYPVHFDEVRIYITRPANRPIQIESSYYSQLSCRTATFDLHNLNELIQQQPQPKERVNRLSSLDFDPSELHGVMENN